MAERIILNPSTSAQNVVNRQEMEKIIKLTMRQLAKQLLDVSGPYSRNDFILQNIGALTSGLNTDLIEGKKSAKQEFTRDGIRTLKAIEYASPIQRYLKGEVLTWIGERIDAMCHDGTTTSMLYASSFLMYLLGSASAVTMSPLVEIEQAYDDVVERVTKELDAYRVTYQGLVERLTPIFKSEGHVFTEEMARVMLARMQASTSAAGREDVASAVAQVVGHTPYTGPEKETGITFRVPNSETKEIGIKAGQEEYEYVIPTTALTTHLFNTEKGRAYESDDVDVFVFMSAFMNGSPIVIALINYLKNNLERYAGKKDFLVMIPSTGRNDIQMIQTVGDQFAEKGLKMVVVGYERPFGYNSPSDSWYYLIAMLGKADIDPLTESVIVSSIDPYFDAAPYIVKNVSVRIDYHNSHFNKLVDFSRIPKEKVEELKSMNVHPGEYYPDLYPNYTACKAHLRQEIDDLNADVREDYQRTIIDIKRGLASMTALNSWFIDILGKTHDVDMYKSIIEDAAGASMIALRDGVFFNGPIKLYKALSDLFIREHSPDQIQTVIMLAMLCAARDIVYAMYGPHVDRITNPIQQIIEPAAGAFEYLDLVKETRFSSQLSAIPFSFFKDEPERDLLVTFVQDQANLIEPKIVTYARSLFWPDTVDAAIAAVATPPCQVGNLFDVLFHRLREVTLRLVFTDNIIAPGTMWDDGSLNLKK